MNEVRNAHSIRAQGFWHVTLQTHRTLHNLQKQRINECWFWFFILAKAPLHQKLTEEKGRKALALTCLVSGWRRTTMPFSSSIHGFQLGRGCNSSRLIFSLSSKAFYAPSYLTCSFRTITPRALSSARPEASEWKRHRLNGGLLAGSHRAKPKVHGADDDILSSVDMLREATPESITFTGNNTIPVTSKLHLVTPEEDTPSGKWPIFRLMVSCHPAV